MSADPCELTQAFRSRSTDEVVKLIVLWKDIQNEFENAKSIRNGESLNYTTSDRLSTWSNARGTGKVHSTGETASLTEITSENGELRHHNTGFCTQPSAEYTTGLGTLIQTFDALVDTYISTTNNSLIMSSTRTIHLVKHEGYDLKRPTEFFERYGSYILALIYMVKFGITAAGLIVPPLASLRILEGLDTTREHVKYLKNNIGPLVDITIKALEDFKSNGVTITELVTDYTDFDKLAALEGADLRQLESFLKLKDEKQVLGSLYRIVTLEGHVKWTGRIEIEIRSSVLARQFYDTMVKAPRIQELEITLKWDVTMDDLRSSKASTTFSLVSPNPLWHVFQVSSVLCESGIPFKEKGKSLNVPFEYCTALTALELEPDHPDSIAKVAQDILNKLNKLESLKIDCGDISVTTRALERKIQFLEDERFTDLAIEYTVEEDDEGQLADLLRRTPNLKHLQIGCKTKRFLAITNLSLLTFKEDRHAYMDSLQDGMSITDTNPVNDFIRDYGWSVVFSDEYRTYKSEFAADILDYFPITRDTQLESLRLNCQYFTAVGFGRVDRIIKRSPNFKDLGLIVDIHNARGESESTRPWTALKKIKILGVKLQPEEWKTVIEAIDFSELQHLNPWNSRITREAFKLLVDRISDNNTPKMQFLTLDIRHTGIADIRATLKELQKKAPLIEIIGTPSVIGLFTLPSLQPSNQDK
ncbi:hypothetical protein BGZ65_004117 [Modicella reniformis]|uniref:Uncharacterized protein n=1 Tax=Modicella reniformis TaxID=1440133 RepID=A0A9P6J7A4_9FUNG|nr:hypothetical protein BGZ65_004117 [Modicella reniformis]